MSRTNPRPTELERAVMDLAYGGDEEIVLLPFDGLCLEAALRSLLAVVHRGGNRACATEGSS